MTDRRRGDTDGDGDESTSTYERIYAQIRRIPRGRVATYGQIAALAGIHNGARQVGYALSATPPGLRLPWHRVINARGEVSERAVSGAELRQRILLEREGIDVDDSGRISLKRYRWQPRVPVGDRDDAFEQFRRR